jgi:hypothetical protein
MDKFEFAFLKRADFVGTFKSHENDFVHVVSAGTVLKKERPRIARGPLRSFKQKLTSAATTTAMSPSATAPAVSTTMPSAATTSAGPAATTSAVSAAITTTIWSTITCGLGCAFDAVEVGLVAFFEFGAAFERQRGSA